MILTFVDIERLYQQTYGADLWREPEDDRLRDRLHAMGHAIAHCQTRIPWYETLPLEQQADLVSAALTLQG